MVLPISEATRPRTPPPVAPTDEAWRAMTQEERERLLVTILDALSDPRRRMMEDLEAKAEEAQAQADQAMKGLREALVALLGNRGIQCPDEARTRISSCHDPATLQRWLLRAMTAGALDEVFAP